MVCSTCVSAGTRSRSSTSSIPDEIEFPFDGMVKFDGLELGEKLLTRPQLIRNTYLKALKTYMTEFQKGCERNRVDYVQLNTGRPAGGGTDGISGKAAEVPHGLDNACGAAR